MHRLKLLSLAMLLPLLLAACASPAAPAATPEGQTTVAGATAVPSAEPAVKTVTDANLGTILTGAKGMTLYLYTKDDPNVSNCYDQCAQNWPPLVIEEGEPTAMAGLPGVLGTALRKDGSRQVTYNGAPLYYWLKDTKPGDTTGQGFGGVWFVVPPGTAGLPTVKTANDQSLGTILTDRRGMTLYRFTSDQPNASMCYDQCAQNWPPVLATEGAPALAGGVPGRVGTTTRDDGAEQVTYDGMPLYYWAKDGKPGDTTGQGVNGVWFVVQPATASSTEPR